MLRRDQDHSYRPALVVFAAGLLIALLWTFVLFPRLGAIRQVFDLNGFGEIGERIWRGEGFSYGHGPTIRRAPLYPYLVAGVFEIFGFDGAHRRASYAPVLALQCLFAGLTCLAVFCIANRLFGKKVGLVAGLLCAVWPQCVRYTGAVDVEATMTLLITLMTLLTVRIVQRTTIADGALLGVVTGLAVLTKPMPLFFPAALFLLFLVRYRRDHKPIPWAPLGACVGAMVLLCVPWVVRNHVVSGGRYHGISSNASGEFLRGYVVARPEFAFLRVSFQGYWDWQANLYEDEILKREGFAFFATENGKLVPMPQNVGNALRKDEIENRVAKEMALHDPIGFARKFVIQLFTFWYLVETPGKSLVVGAFAALALALAFVGWRRARKDRVDVAPVVTVVAYFYVLYAVILAFARYSMPVFPSLLVLSAYGLCAMLAGREATAHAGASREPAEDKTPAVA